jgi:hypothetical protein
MHRTARKLDRVVVEWRDTGLVATANKADIARVLIQMFLADEELQTAVQRDLRRTASR